MKPAVYVIRNLTKIYRHGNVLANHDICLDIRPGEILGILGPNGAGKTTLVRQMAGLVRPTSGFITLQGVDIQKNPGHVPRQVAYFAQAPWILWSHKVWEAIYFTGIFRGMTKKAAMTQTDALLEELGLAEIRNQLMERISGGQSKMLGIATALIGDRSILIFDEPTNDLDPANRAKIWRLFSALCHQQGTTIILVTHNIYEAEHVVDRVVIIDKGKIIASGTPGELKSRVDNRIRIEIKLKENAPFKGIDFLDTFTDCRQVKPGKWQIFIAKHEISSVYSEIIERIHIDHLDDFRLITTTLEDVYLQLGGKAGQFNDG